MNGRVFVVQEPGNKNILDATRYGKIEVMLPKGQIMFSPGPSIFRLRQALSDFSDDDYILCVGDPVAIGFACAIAANSNRGNIKMLKWDRQEKQYYPVQGNVYGKHS